MNNKSQPIAVQNVVDYLMAALDNPSGYGKVFEIGGPEITSYKNLILRYACGRGLERRMLILPYIPLWFMSFGVGLMTPVPHPIAYALIGGLSHHSVVKYDDVLRVFPEVKLIGFDEAIQIALARLSPKHIERVWEDDEDHTKTLKHEGFFIDYRKIKVAADSEKVFSIITKFAEYFGTRRFTVDTVEPDHLLLLRSQLKTPGEGWIEWRVGQIGNLTYLTQTAFFAPRGTAGFLCWYLLSPLRAIIFHRLIKNIASNSMVE